MKMLSAVTIFVLALTGIVACGPTTVAGGGTGGTGAVAYGTVTQLGSVWVNGVQWETDGADIYMDGNNVGTGDASPGGGYIDRGMVVKVEGDKLSAVSGNAKTITYRKTVAGPVDSINAAANTLVVLGQTVLFEPGLTFDEKGAAPAGLADLSLAPGDNVEVSGHIDATGQVHARFIGSRPADATGYVVRAYVKSVTSPTEFTIGALTVVHSGELTLTAGDFVEVTGSNLDQQNNILTADSVTPLPTELGDVEDTDEFELEGLVQRIDPVKNELTLSGYLVRWYADTVFDGGLAANIVVGDRLEVEGALSSGILEAREIEFEDAIEIKGKVSTADGSELTMVGLPNLSIAYSAGPGIYAPTAGEDVSLRARERDGKPEATGIERIFYWDGWVEVQGPYDASTSTVLGLSLDGLGEYFVDDRVVSKTDFFSAVSAQDLIEVEGLFQSGTVYWQNAEKE